MYVIECTGQVMTTIGIVLHGVVYFLLASYIHCSQCPEVDKVFARLPEEIL